MDIYTYEYIWILLFAPYPEPLYWLLSLEEGGRYLDEAEIRELPPS